jgi:hypothetical protein
MKFKIFPSLLRSYALLSLTLVSLPCFAQFYFQQEVNYQIQVQLDDRAHMLHGFETFKYHNHSLDTMEVLFIHLWPNAYKNAKTALAKQKMKSGDFFLLYAGQSDRGYIDLKTSLSFHYQNLWHPEKK